jgi:hypothetical protein
MKATKYIDGAYFSTSIFIFVVLGLELRAFI